MTEAYSVFANGGFAIKPYLISRIENHDGSVIFQANPAAVCQECEQQTTSTSKQANRVISEQVNFIMNSLLRDVVQRGTATQAKQLGRNDLAGKTGTTNDMRDAWFNGFNSDIVASAWLGFDNSASLGKGETGGKAALPMWIGFMKTALQGLPEKPLLPPPGITQAYINPKDGLLIDPKTGNGIWEYFSEETLPTTSSVAHSDNIEGGETGDSENSLF
jgi:penicillin-binding protein 1A